MASTWLLLVLKIHWWKVSTTILSNALMLLRFPLSVRRRLALCLKVQKTLPRVSWNVTTSLRLPTKLLMAHKLKRVAVSLKHCRLPMCLKLMVCAQVKVCWLYLHLKRLKKNCATCWAVCLVTLQVVLWLKNFSRALNALYLLLPMVSITKFCPKLKTINVLAKETQASTRVVWVRFHPFRLLTKLGCRRWKTRLSVLQLTV